VLRHVSDVSHREPRSSLAVAHRPRVARPRWKATTGTPHAIRLQRTQAQKLSVCWATGTRRSLAGPRHVTRSPEERHVVCQPEQTDQRLDVRALRAIASQVQLRRHLADARARKCATTSSTRLSRRKFETWVTTRLAAGALASAGPKPTCVDEVRNYLDAALVVAVELAKASSANQRRGRGDCHRRPEPQNARAQ